MTRILIFLLLVSFSINAQINETFSDGDFSNNPSWIGTEAKFAVDAQLRLQLNATPEASSAWLFTQSSAIEEASWKFDFIFDFNPSTSNYAKIWIAADNSDPSQIKNGILVSLGASDDAVLLQSVVNGKTTTLIKGLAGRLNRERIEGGVKVVRDGNNWTLDLNIDGSMVTEGTAQFAPAVGSNWFGIVCTYTQTRSNKFWFDNIVVTGQPLKDRVKPKVVSHAMRRPDLVEVKFSEPVNIGECEVSFLDKVINLSQHDSQSLNIGFAPVDADVIDKPLQLKNIFDIAGNVLNDTVLRVSYSLFRVIEARLELPSVVAISLNNRPVDVPLAAISILIDNVETAVEAAAITGNSVNLTLKYGFQAGKAYRIRLAGLKDIDGNSMIPFEGLIGNIVIGRGSVLITEFMADPEPSMGLPVSEYIELYNNTPLDINLRDWKITVNQVTGLLPSYILKPGEYVTLSPSANVKLFESEKTISPSRWPEITNSGASIILSSPQGVITDAIAFSLAAWGDQSFKEDGGWAFEITDITNRCADNTNWSYSTNNKGGTPSQPNSNQSANPDKTLPDMKYVRVLGDGVVSFNFSEPVKIDNQRMTINGVEEEYEIVGVDNIFLKRIDVRFKNLPSSGTVYSVDKAEISDLAGNSLECNLMGRFGIAESVEANDLVINEIMFNTAGDAPDFIEIYNRSKKVVSLKEVSIGKLSGGKVKSITPVSSADRYIFPGDYIVASIDSLKTVAAYNCKESLWVVKTNKFPSLSDDGECLMLAQPNGEAVESFCFDKSYHSPLLLKHDGVSLERISPDKPADNRSNWKSAAASHGYSTPTSINSQYRVFDDDGSSAITLQPSYFTPDGDGNDDFMAIGYNTPSPGWNGTVMIYDSRGYMIKMVANNEILGTAGMWIWDGLDDNNRRVREGNYIVLVKMFSTDGEVKTIKKSCTVGVRINQ